MQSVQEWLDRFSLTAASSDGAATADLFLPDGLWRDYLSFGWTLKTVEGHGQIAAFTTENSEKTGFSSPAFEGEVDDTEGFFQFQTNQGNGRGYLRLQDGLCSTLFTMQDDLSNLQTGNSSQHAIREPSEPYVLIIGGGQSGLALGAQLSHLGVPYLIVDKYPCVGDQWRSRYDSLVLHDPVWYDHMPFIPFPEDWPVFTPKNEMGDWLEAYAEKLSLSIQTNTTFMGASYDEVSGRWHATINTADKTTELCPSHLVFALGISGFPNIPAFDGQNDFKSQQFHSSAYKGGQDLSGKNVVVIGANNSAHDIAADAVKCGAKPIMVQRSSTLVVRQSDYCEKLLGPLYSEQALARGITTDRADILTASMPMRLLETKHRPIWDAIREDQKGYYQRLTDAGFTIDFAEDGTGLGMKYRRTASGYYIDVGAAEMVMDGRIGIRSGVNVERVTETGVSLDTGEELPADMIVYATGYGSMTDWVAALIDTETAEKIGRCWGYGSNTKGDPGPWVGELRNMWMPTAQEGLWFMGGNLSQARFCSKLLALQLQARFLS